MSWPTSGMVAPAFSHSTLRSSSGEGGSGSSSFFTQAGVPWGLRRLSQALLLGVCCFSGYSVPSDDVGRAGANGSESVGGKGGERGSLLGRDSQRESSNPPYPSSPSLGGS